MRNNFPIPILSLSLSLHHLRRLHAAAAVVVVVVVVGTRTSANSLPASNWIRLNGASCSIRLASL